MKKPAIPQSEDRALHAIFIFKNFGVLIRLSSSAMKFKNYYSYSVKNLSTEQVTFLRNLFS